MKFSLPILNNLESWTYELLITEFWKTDLQISDLLDNRFFVYIFELLDI